MDFNELLNKPLPSKGDNDIFESEEDDEDIFSESELDDIFGDSTNDDIYNESEEDDEDDIFSESELDDLFDESELDDIFGESDDDVATELGDMEKEVKAAEESEDEEMDIEEGNDVAEEDCEGSCEESIDDDTIANELEDIMADDPDYEDDDDELDDIGDEDLTDISMDDEEPEPLTGEDDKKADDLMAIASTPLLLRDELTAEESAQFYESEEGQIAIAEGLLLESDMDDLFEEGVFANPNKPFKMTKKARFNQLYELSVQIEARMRQDPMYAKLQKAYAIERICKKQLRAKYHPYALKRAKIYLKRLMKSKSGVLAKIGKKIGLKKAA